MEKILSSLRSVNNYELWVSINLIGSLILPGLLAIWIYDPEFLKQAGTFKLMILSSAVAFPCAFIHFIILESLISLTKSANQKIKELTSDTLVNMQFGALLSGFLLYIMCFFAFFFSFSIKIFVLIYLLLNALAICSVIFATKLGLLPEEL